MNKNVIEKLNNKKKIVNPWNITIFLNNGYLEDIEIHFERVTLRESDIPGWVENWVIRHLRFGSGVRLSYSICHSDFDRYNGFPC